MSRRQWPEVEGKKPDWNIMRSTYLPPSKMAIQEKWTINRRRQEIHAMKIQEPRTKTHSVWRWRKKRPANDKRIIQKHLRICGNHAHRTLFPIRTGACVVHSSRRARIGETKTAHAADTPLTSAFSCCCCSASLFVCRLCHFVRCSAMFVCTRAFARCQSV